jgi:hypothetical protein
MELKSSLKVKNIGLTEDLDNQLAATCECRMVNEIHTRRIE